MSQSLAKNLIHLVFSTKNRQAVDSAGRSVNDSSRIKPASSRNGNSPALIIGGVEDHVHALFLLSKNHPLTKIVEQVKKGSSKWMKRDGGNADFYWQNGYAAFSVSESNVEQVRRYIQNQEQHHRKMTFQDELRALLKRHRVEFDERVCVGLTLSCSCRAHFWITSQPRAIDEPRAPRRFALG